jgi:nucleotide-binding universal stress UspA family protein
MYRKIIVPLDGSQTAESVLPYARALATQLKLPVELIAAIDLSALAPNVSPGQGLFLDRLADDEGRRLSEYLVAIAKSFAGAEVVCRVVKGPAAEVILNAAADAEALVNMATHGRSGLDRFLLGSVAEKVLRATNNPLLLVRAGEHSSAEGQTPFQAILVPLDGSELAEKALPAVIDLACKLNLKVILFRAYAIPVVGLGGAGFYAMEIDSVMAALRADATEYLQTQADHVRSAGVREVSCAVQEGLGADEIIKFAQNSDCLIAMSTHGRSGIERWALGSVTEAVVRHVNAPVLIVRGV